MLLFCSDSDSSDVSDDRSETRSRSRTPERQDPF